MKPGTKVSDKQRPVLGTGIYNKRLSNGKHLVKFDRGWFQIPDKDLQRSKHPIPPRGARRSVFFTEAQEIARIANGLPLLR